MDNTTQNLKKKLYRQTPKGKYEVYKNNAIKCRREFSLTFEQFMLLWQKPCYFCGEPIDTICLNRLDNSKGYTLDNIVPCCVVHNKMKRDHTEEEFIKLCQDVLDHQKKINEENKNG